MTVQLSSPRDVLERFRSDQRGSRPLAEARVLEVGCELCGRSQDFVILHERIPQIDTPSRVQQCPDCRLVFLSPRLASNDDDWAQHVSYLESNYLPELAQRGICDRELRFDQDANLAWHEEIFATLDLFRTSATLLDVGCAIGITLHAGRALGWIAHGVEASSTLAHYGSSQLHVAISVGEFDTMQHPWRSLDAITMLDYLPHCFRPFQSLQRAHTLLRPGGVLFTSSPNVAGRSHAKHGVSWCCYVTDHYFHYTADTLMRSLREAGFRSILVLSGRPLPREKLRRHRGLLTHAREHSICEMLGKPTGDALHAWAIK